MAKPMIFVVGCLMLCASASPQERPRDLKGGGHLLGETAEQFFSEGLAGDVQQACQRRDWKTVRQLSQETAQTSKINAKNVCATEELAKQQATGGTRLEYRGRGDAETMRADTFTFDGGHLVKIRMVYSVPIANVEGYRPKTFAELFAGLQEAYGSPSKSYTEPFVNAFGVKYAAHRAQWMMKQGVISIIEQPGENGRTEIIAETTAEHDRAAHAPKATNPLQ